LFQAASTRQESLAAMLWPVLVGTWPPGKERHIATSSGLISVAP
jgi:hypothetical protein